ncbi:hypothetical protein RyT2_15550 [Pseudolactococcus yaeyamensis]
MPMTAKQMIKLLKKNGSHKQFINYETGRQTTVPIHSKDLKKGTEQGILKQAGLK